jgi:hypothetical protein
MTQDEKDYVKLKAFCERRAQLGDEDAKGALRFMVEFEKAEPLTAEQLEQIWKVGRPRNRFASSH